MWIYKNLGLGDLNGEIWIPIQNFPNYLISNLGRVKSIARYISVQNGGVRLSNERIIKQSFNVHGYLFVYLYNKSAVKMLTTHRLVGIHFIENPQNKPQINHKNGIKYINTHYNLEWNTREENINHAFVNGLIHTAKGSDHYAAKEVVNIETGEIFLSLKDAAKTVEIPYSTLKSQCVRNSKSAIFKYNIISNLK